MCSGSSIGRAPRGRVLLADDEQVNRAVLRRAIERGGFDAVETSTGAEAVLAFQNQGEDGGFLCVLMDINMPEMDGLEAAWRIRQIEGGGACESCRARLPAMLGEEFLGASCQECCRVPIWAVSACSDKDQTFSPVVHHLHGALHAAPLWRQVGMDEYMAKPVNVLQLKHKLAKLLGDLRRPTSGDNIACSDANLRMELARSGSLSSSYSDSQMWETQVVVGAPRSEDSARLSPFQPPVDTPCLLVNGFELQGVPDLGSKPQNCPVA